MRDDNGVLRGFAKVTRDLTEPRRAAEVERRLAAEEAARRAAEDAHRRIAAILTNLSDGVTVQEPSGRVIYANDAAPRSAGLSRAPDTVDADLSELVARFRVLDDVGDPVPPAALPGRRVLAGEAAPPSLLQIEDVRSGRRTWILLAANAITDADGAPILAVNV